MILRSIGNKLQAMIICAFLAMGIGIITLTFYQTASVEENVTNIVKADQHTIYSLKLDEMLRVANNANKQLQQTLTELGLTGTEMAARYLQEAQKEVLDEIRTRYYTTQNEAIDKLEVYPFVVDQSAQIVLHPQLAAGESLAKESFAKQMVAGEEFFKYEFQGVKKFMFSKTMPEWKWVISFVMPEESMLAPVQAVSTSIETLQTRTAIFISGIAILSVLILGLAISRWVTRPLNQVIIGLTNSAALVTTAARQIASSSQLLAQGATEQAAGLEETSSSLEEMSSMTKQNANNAAQANTLASEAQKTANEGNEAMVRMGKAIEDIKKSSDETAKIIKVIDEIAFQTNLLALNAAVEAARAGEAGKGFAVVAEEVRNLAMRSAEAAKNTSNLIEGSVKKSNNGVEICTEVKISLDEIVRSIGKTTDLVGEIAAASNEQAQGVDQINAAVSQMDKVTQQNASNAEESASASQELSTQATFMNQTVEELITLVNGTKKHQQPANYETHSSQTRKHPGKPGQLKPADHLYHQIASTGK